MKSTLLACALAFGLTACAGGGSTPAPPTPAPYSAVGSWRVLVRPDGAGDWRDVGVARFISQSATGGLDGIYTLADGTTTGRAVGNVTAGTVGLIVGYNVVSMTGTFSGNSYAGRYDTVFLDGSDPKGDVKMSR